MAEFQFYRPQVNALEQLWSKYVDTQAALGGAFERGLAPGLAAGFETMNKNLQAQKEREFQTAEREAGEAASAKKARQAEIAQNLRFVRGLDRDEQIATDRINAEKQQAQNEAERKAQQAEAVLIGVGVPQDEARELAKELRDPQTANMWADNQRDVAAKAAEDAERKKQEEREKNQRDTVQASIARLDALNAWTPAERRQYINRANAGDPADLPQLMTDIDALSVETDSRNSAIRSYKEFVRLVDQQKKDGASLVSPSKLEEFAAALGLAEGAAAKLNDRRYMAEASPEEKRRIKDLLVNETMKMRVMMGMAGPRDPEVVAQVAKQYPGLERLMGKNVLYGNGYIQGTPQQNANFQKLVNDKLRDDFELQQKLRNVGVSDTAALLASIAAGGALTVPDDSGEVASLISEAKERLGRQALEEMGVNVQSVSVPSGYRDVRALSQEERSAFRADFAAAAQLFSFAQGRLPTMQEGQQIAANLGYWDINAPTLRKIEAKKAEAKKAETKPQPKAAEQQPAKPADQKPADQKPAEAKKAAAPEKKPAVAQAPAGPPAGPPPPAAALAGVLALPEGRLRMPSKEEAKAIAQERELETRRVLYGNSQRSLLEGIVSPRAQMPGGTLRAMDALQQAARQQAEREAYGMVLPQYTSQRMERAQAMRMPAGGGPVINVPSTQRLLPQSLTAPSTTAPYFRAMGAPVRPIGPMLR
jgi:hypothetical protein